MAETFEGSGIKGSSITFPVYDGTLMSFIKDVQRTTLLDRNYPYIYSRNRMRTLQDELRMIERASIMDMSLYTASSAVMEAGMKRLVIICRYYALCGMMDVAVGSLRGLGYAVMPMIVSLIGACGLRLIWIFTFFRMEAFHTTTSLYLTYPVSWLVTFTVHIICFIIVRRKLEKMWNPGV